jgi:tRNA-(MS[2]IO[6]A)-hydroxylase MiaE-like protein
VPSVAAVVDLLGALAYGQLSAFDHLADDAGLAPALGGRAEMSSMAALEFGHYERIAGRLRELGAEPEDAMAPFVAALESYHALTQPSTWLEGVVKAYVGDGMAADFYREVAAFVDDTTRDLIHEVLQEGDRAGFAVRELQRVLAEQPSIAGRLALWARRLVGEAISQVQHVLADRDSLMLLLVEGAGDLTGVAALITRITDRHTERMVVLGLDRPAVSAEPAALESESPTGR